MFSHFYLTFLILFLYSYRFLNLFLKILAMDDITKDDRFKHIPTDSRFRVMPRKDRKFKVDNRFKVSVIIFFYIQFINLNLN